MAPRVVHISGPRRSGKTSIARKIAGRFAAHPPCYLRFVCEDGGAPPPVLHEPMPEMREARRCLYTTARLFEQLPAALTQTRRIGRDDVILLETDADACFRLAHPYDVRVFVMPAPRYIDEVFRAADEANKALCKALQDTGVFASEIFGMDRLPGLDDTRSGVVLKGTSAAPPPAGSEADALKRALSTALGAEIAARTSLQPNYHGLVDADAVILNAGVGGGGETVDICARRIEKLIDLLPIERARRPRFFCCDPLDEKDPFCRKSLETIVALIAPGRATKQ